MKTTKKNYLANLEIGGVIYDLKDQELAEKLESKLDRVFVESLPDVSDAKDNVLYVLPSKTYIGNGVYITEYLLYVLSDDKTNLIQIGKSADDKFYSKDELNVSDDINYDSSLFDYIIPSNSAVKEYVDGKIGVKDGDKVLSYSENKFESTITLYYNSKDKQIELRGVDNSVIAFVSTESIVGSAIVKTAYLTEKDDKTYIVIEFETSDPEGSNVEIDVSRLIDLYNGSNLMLSDTYEVPQNYTAPVSGMSMDSAIGNLVKKDRLIEARIDELAKMTSSIPKGIICMWSGLMEDIPNGWHLCDGSDGTPDLRNRFIVGIGSKYGVGDTGGNDSITLTESQMPLHNHSGSTGNNTSSSQTITTSKDGSHTHTAQSSSNTHNHEYHPYKYNWNSGEANGKGSGRIVSITESTTTLKTVNDTHVHTISVYQTNSEHTHRITIPIISHTHSITTSNTGGSSPFDNRPMYYALAYIMKIAEGSDSGDGTSSNDTCIKCADLDEKDYPVGTFAMHSGATGTYRRGFIYERTDNGWVSTLVQNVIQ